MGHCCLPLVHLFSLSPLSLEFSGPSFLFCCHSNSSCFSSDPFSLNSPRCSNVQSMVYGSNRPDILTSSDSRDFFIWIDDHFIVNIVSSFWFHEIHIIRSNVWNDSIIPITIFTSIYTSSFGMVLHWFTPDFLAF